MSTPDRQPAPLRPPQDNTWHLTLFVAGGHGRSRRAIENLRVLCATHLPPDTAVEVVDIHRSPAAALRHAVLVAPTLLRHAPSPARRVVGDLSDTPAVLRGLDLATDRHAGD